MTQEQKTNWINALRSGKYRQGQGQLYNSISNRYCCIGVFGKVNNIMDEHGSLVNELTEQEEINTVEKFDKKPYYLQFAQFLPNNIPDETFVRMNDRERKSFEKIADYIEQNIPTTD